MYILRLNVLIESDEDLSLETNITDQLEEILDPSKAKLVSTNIEELYGLNYGKCSICNCWVSDYRNTHPISVFSNGAKINDTWFCDICISEDHPISF